MPPAGKLWCTGAMHRQIAGALTGRVTKWVVLVAWLIVIAAASSFKLS